MGQPITLQVHRLLALSAPVPLPCKAVAAKLRISEVSAKSAIRANVLADCVVRVRRVDGGPGYAYTVSL